MGFMDFHLVPGPESGELETASPPFFMKFLRRMVDLNDPSLKNIPIQVWISGDKKTDAQLINHIYNSDLKETFLVIHLEYNPAKYERLEDLHKKKAEPNIHIIFMIRMGYKTKTTSLPKSFEAPDTNEFSVAGAYNEMDYRIYENELRMEFYIRILDLFCDPGDAVYTVHGKGKILCPHGYVFFSILFISPRFKVNLFLCILLVVLANV